MKIVRPPSPLLLLAVLAAGTLVPLALGAAPTSGPAAAEQIERTGFVVAWRLDMDGTIYVLLRHAPAEGPDAERTTWFTSPPHKAADRDVEEMLLHVLMDSDDPADERMVTVAAQEERQLAGDDPESALPLVWISVP